MVSKVEKADELAIISRAIDPDSGNWSESLANMVAGISVSNADRDRMHVLAKLARAGTLSPEQEAEMNVYLRATGILDILKAKAHLSLIRAGKRL